MAAVVEKRSQRLGGKNEALCFLKICAVTPRVTDMEGYRRFLQPDSGPVRGDSDQTCAVELHFCRQPVP